MPKQSIQDSAFVVGSGPKGISNTPGPNAAAAHTAKANASKSGTVTITKVAASQGAFKPSK